MKLGEETRTHHWKYRVKRSSVMEVEKRKERTCGEEEGVMWKNLCFFFCGRSNQKAQSMAEIEEDRKSR